MVDNMTGHMGALVSVMLENGTTDTENVEDELPDGATVGSEPVDDDSETLVMSIVVKGVGVVKVKNGADESGGAVTVNE
jgi:hypothetical protein